MSPVSESMTRLTKRRLRYLVVSSFEKAAVIESDTAVINVPR